MIEARQALISSLNIPFVHLLQQYSEDKFYYFLKDMLKFDENSPELYGLSLILGTKEFSVEEQIKNLKKEKMDINFNIIKLEKNYNKYKNDNNELEKEIEKFKKKVNKDKSYIEIQLKEIKRLEEIISLNNEKK